jgi:flagellar hook-basal body complex protein FliE
MTVNPVSAVGAVDPSTVSNLLQQISSGTGTDPTASTSTIGSDLSTALGGDLAVDPATLSPTSAAGQAMSTRGSSFASMIGGGLQKVENLDMTAQTKAISAATGDLSDVHDYVIAAQEAQTATELTTTLRNKALDSFNQIMGMSL